MPPVAGGGPRTLLRRLREIMAEQGSAQSRLDKLVTVIAANMVAEVCSIYLRRAGKVLELFATEGLNPGAVHRTRMKAGEGLVGLVADTAEAVNLSDAPNDPHFPYRPETGEDPYHSFLGVPIVRVGRCSVFSPFKTVSRANTAKKKSKHCRPSPWCWPNRSTGRSVQCRRAGRAGIQQ